MSSSNVVVLTNDNFKSEVLDSTLPVMVDFWAEWCGPCKMVTPIVEALSSEMSDKIKICKLNVDEARETAATYQVMSIPTMIFFKNGKIVSQEVGAQGKAAYVKIINEL